MFKMLIFSFIVSLVIGLVLGPFVIKKLKQFHARQSEREEGPESHKYKAGTPTMGGILILTALTVACLLFDPMEIRKALALFLTLGHGVIGFWMIPSRPLNTAIWALRQNRNWPASSSWLPFSATSSKPSFIFPRPCGFLSRRLRLT